MLLTAIDVQAEHNGIELQAVAFGLVMSCKSVTEPGDALEILLDCFLEGEIASFVNDGEFGLHTYVIELPAGVTCDHCVLRWKWDYGFLGCADVGIQSSVVGVPTDRPLGISWGSIKRVYR